MADSPNDWNVPRRINLDSELLLARGAVQGKFVVHKFGRNAGVPNASFEEITILGQQS